MPNQILPILFLSISVFSPHESPAAVLALRPQKPGQTRLTRLQKNWCAVIPVWSESCRMWEKIQANLLWWVELVHDWVFCLVTVAAHQDQSLESCPPVTKISKTIKISKLEKTQKLGRECAREAQLQLRDRPKSIAWCWVYIDWSWKVVFFWIDVPFMR